MFTKFLGITSNRACMNFRGASLTWYALSDAWANFAYEYMVRISESHIRSESVRNNLNFKYKTVGTDDVDFWIVLYFWISCVVVAIFWTFLLRDPDIFFQMFLDKSSEHFRISVPVQRFPKMLPKKLLFISHILASMNSDVRCKGIGIMERLFTEFALVWGFFCMDTSHVSS